MKQKGGTHAASCFLYIFFHVFLTVSQNVEYFSITLIDKTESADHTKTKEYWRYVVKTLPLTLTYFMYFFRENVSISFNAYFRHSSLLLFAVCGLMFLTSLFHYYYHYSYCYYYYNFCNYYCCYCHCHQLLNSKSWQ